MIVIILVMAWDTISSILGKSSKVQMAYATAICAAEATNRHEPLSNACGNLTLQIQCCFGDECLQKARGGQKIIDTYGPKEPVYVCPPASICPDLAPSRCSVVTWSKFKDAQGGDLNFQRSAYVNDEPVNSRTIALRRHLGMGSFPNFL